VDGCADEGGNRPSPNERSSVAYQELVEKLRNVHAVNVTPSGTRGRSTAVDWRRMSGFYSKVAWRSSSRAATPGSSTPSPWRKPRR
jgi:hypothetical protein